MGTSCMYNDDHEAFPFFVHFLVMLSIRMYMNKSTVLIPKVTWSYSSNRQG